MTITMDKLNSMIGVVGEYVKKMNVISNTFNKANDYQSWLKVNEDTLIIRSCFTKLGHLYVDTHSDYVELPVEVTELFNEVIKIASNRCLVVPDDDIPDNDEDNIELNETDFTIDELSIIHRALEYYKFNIYKENKLNEVFKVWDLSNKVLDIQERIFLRR